MATTRSILTRSERDTQKIVDAILDIDQRLTTVEASVASLLEAPPRIIGEVMDFAGDTPPAKWLLCHGQAVSRTTYADLFAAIGVTWGGGDGTTTFNLPDLRGRVGAGRDDMGGVAAERLTTDGSNLDGTGLGNVGGDEHLQEHTHTL